MVWDIDPTIFQFKFIQIRWYGLMYVLGFSIGYFLLTRMLKREGKSPALADPVLNYMVLGTLVGARLGHCLFYEPGLYLSDPLRILKVWEGGLASHGGYLGIILAMMIFAKRYKQPYLWLADRLTIMSIMTGGFIRLGNLFNSEILGTPTDVPWAFQFVRVDRLWRHPTPIYEAIGYLSIAALLYLYYSYMVRSSNSKKLLPGRILGLGLIMGFSFRFFVEQFKVNQVAFERQMSFNMGQLLSIPFILVGILLVSGHLQRLVPGAKNPRVPSKKS